MTPMTEVVYTDGCPEEGSFLTRKKLYRQYTHMTSTTDQTDLNELHDRVS